MSVCKTINVEKTITVTVSRHALERYIQRTISLRDIERAAKAGVEKTIAISVAEFHQIRIELYRELDLAVYGGKNYAGRRNIYFTNNDGSLIFLCVPSSEHKGDKNYIVTTIVNDRLSKKAAKTLIQSKASVMVEVDGVQIPMYEYCEQLIGGRKGE